MLAFTVLERFPVSFRHIMTSLTQFRPPRPVPYGRRDNPGFQERGYNVPVPRHAIRCPSVPSIFHQVSLSPLTMSGLEEVIENP